MDKKNSEVRKYIAQRAELLGAIRLPNNTFTKNAGTKVTSDILFLKKRENMTDIMPDWVYLDTDKNGITMNKYFVDNPDMILGTMEMEPTQYGRPDSTCKPYEGIELKTLLDEAKEKIEGEITEYEIGDIEEREETMLPADPSVKNFSYTIIDGKVYFRENSVMAEQDLPITTISRIKGMIELRDCVRDLIDLQTEDYPEENIKVAQAKLNRMYDNYVKKYGIINSRGNRLAFEADSSYYLLCSLEVMDSEGRFVRKADMFSKRTIKAYKEITSVDTANEALIVSLSEKASVDLEYMSKLTNKTQEELVKELDGIIYKLPMENNKYVTSDEYLSGNIREKLKMAEASVGMHPEFATNIEALKQVMPKDLTANEIGIKLGATWIPTEIIDSFMYELLETPNHAQWNMKVKFSEYNSQWYITSKNYDYSNVKANKTYGTNRVNAYEIIEKTLNLKDVKVFDTVTDIDGNKKREFNAKETAIAQAKQDQIKQAFEDWIFNDVERRERLVRLYNDKFNSIRPREYDGSHLNFVGMNPEIKLRKHQQNAIAHILYGRNTLLAHEVRSRKDL
jgi:N12 class adenine-specific DNA methylase